MFQYCIVFSLMDREGQYRISARVKTCISALVCSYFQVRPKDYPVVEWGRSLTTVPVLVLR